MPAAYYLANCDAVTFQQYLDAVIFQCVDYWF